MISIDHPHKDRLQIRAPSKAIVGNFRTSRSVDLIVSMGVSVCLSAAIVAWHVATMDRVLPYHDGSHHVANVANLVSLTRQLGALYLVDFAQRSPGDFLTYTFFALPSAIVGSGRIAFAVGWAICLAAITVGFWLAFREEQSMPSRTLALALLVFTGLFQSPLGGAWDTRVDLFAATLGLLCLIATARGALLSAAFLCLAACFAKGAALALLLPLLALACPLGLFRLRERQYMNTSFVLGSCVVIALGGIYLTRVGPQAVSYNLMATGGSGAEDRVRLFMANAWAYVTRDAAFYPNELLGTYHGWILGLVAPALAGALLRGRGRLLRLGVFAALTVGYTDVLLSISPLHSEVLTVWFLPAVGVAVLFLADVARLVIPAPAAAGACLGLILASAVPIRLQPAAVSNSYTAGLSDTFKQADELAAFLDSHFARQSSRIVLLVNFLSAEGPLIHNYDVFRVLLQERLRYANLTIDGWELGTYGGDWRQELASNLGYPQVIFVLAERPAAVPWDNNPQRAGRSVWDGLQRFRSAYPTCVTAAATPIELPDVGRQEVLLLSPEKACREALAAEGSRI